MNLLFLIKTEIGGPRYALFYCLAFLIGFIILLYEGRKRNYPILPWLLIISTCFLSFILGTQFIKYSIEDWVNVINLNPLDHPVGRSVLGGLAFVIPSLLIAKYFLKFRYSIIDSFALVIPIGILIQRFGCLLAGCCYGTPTNAPWGIQYGKGTHPFIDHTSNNLIPIESLSSLSIHPIAIYEIIGCFISLILIFKMRQYFKASGNHFWFAIGNYLLIRFITEFWRANSTIVIKNIHFTLTQLYILCILSFLIYFLIRRENKISIYTNDVSSCYNNNNHNHIRYSASLLILLLPTSHLLASIELLSLYIALIPTFIFFTWNVFKHFTLPSLRIFSVLILLGSFILMSQTIPKQIKNDSTKNSFHSFKIGSMILKSNFTLSDQITTTTYGPSQDCTGATVYGPINNTTVTDYSINNSVKINGASYSFTKKKSLNSTEHFGVDGFWGTHKETVESSSSTKTNSSSIFGIHPYLKFDKPIVGIGFGFHAGNMTTFIEPNNPNLDAVTFKKISFYPSFSFRIGYTDKVFGELKFADQFPTPFPGMSFQTNVGFGFKNKISAIRIGTSTHSAFFASAIFPLGNKLEVESLVGGFPGFINSFSNFNSENESIGFNSSFAGSLSISYKFGFKQLKE